MRMELGRRNYRVIAIVADSKLGSTGRRQTLSDRADGNWPEDVDGRFSANALFEGAAALFFCIAPARIPGASCWRLGSGGNHWLELGSDRSQSTGQAGPEALLVG